jgi:SAM-dependent methyltransferase
MTDISIQKTRDDYNKIAKHFSATRNRLWPELDQFKELIKNGQNILDWGCGNGQFLLFLKDKKIKYYGLDISEKLLKIARARWKDLIKIGEADFYCTADSEKKFPADFFDVAFMVASFHHLPDKESRLNLLKKIFYEMKKNGKLIITVWNLKSDWAKRKLSLDYKKIGKNDFLIPWKNINGEIECERYYHHFTKQELNKLLKEAGFKVKKMVYFDTNTFSEDKKAARNLIAGAEKLN